ncbi:MAG: sialidase family protein [Acidobacteriota bacterium]
MTGEGLHIESDRNPSRRLASDDLVDAARDLLGRGERAEAFDLLLDAAADHSMPGPAWVLLGNQFERAGATDAALAAWARAVSLDTEHRIDLASGLDRLGRHAESMVEWQRLLDIASPTEAAAIGSRLAPAAHLAGASVDPSWLADAPEVLGTIVREGTPPRAAVRTLSPASAALSIGAPVRVDAGGGSELAEPSIVALGDTLAVGWNDLRHPDGLWRLGTAFSTDGGSTWNDALLRAPMSSATSQDGDPMTAVDPRTGSLWLGAIEFAGAGSQVYVSRLTASGFGTPVVVASGSSFDKCWMAAGRAPGNAASTRVYVAYSFPSSLHVSSDLGASWSARRALDPNGLAFMPRVAPDGRLFVGYFDFAGFVEGTGIFLQTSTDGGSTFSQPIRVADRMDAWGLQDGSRFPGRFRVPILPIWAVSPVDGTLYLVYSDTSATVHGDANVDLYFSRSTDDGATWSTPVVIHLDGRPPGDQFFPWIEVDGTGRIHLVYFNSRYTAQVDDVEDARLDVTYAWSNDGGTTWTETRLTPSSFGTRHVDWPILGQFLGDYLGLTVVDDKTVLVAYPRTSGADLDLFVQRIEHIGIFTDGFESGNTEAWLSSSR